MKKVLLFATMLFVAAPNMQAQSGNDEQVKIVLVKEENSDSYYYEGIVPVDGVSKEEMFKRAKDWILSNFKTVDNNAQIDEKEFSIYNNPTLILDKYKSDKGDFVNFKIKLVFKDGKYKFRIDNILVKLKNFPNDPVYTYNGEKFVKGIGVGKYNKDVIENINNTFLKMTVDLENTITKKDNW